MKIALLGASGYLGQGLTRFFAQNGHEVIVISRSKPALPPGARFVAWDAQTLGDWTREIEGSGAVINLAGRSVNCRYNAQNQREILESRVQSTQILGRAISQAQNPPRVWLQASSATIYRDARDRDMDEESGEIGHGFSVGVVQAWEAALFEADLPQTRRVAMRLSMVFSADGPVLEAFLRLVRLGLGGAHAGGGQFVSWLHIRDFEWAVEFLLENEALDGPVNVCAPHPLPNRDFLRALREAWGIRFGIPAPRLGLEIGARLLGTETELLLKSRRVVPGRLLGAGFKFDFPDWPAAARDLMRRS